MRYCTIIVEGRASFVSSLLEFWRVLSVVVVLQHLFDRHKIGAGSTLADGEVERIRAMGEARVNGWLRRGLDRSLKTHQYNVTVKGVLRHTRVAQIWPSSCLIAGWSRFLESGPVVLESRVLIVLAK